MGVVLPQRLSESKKGFEARTAGGDKIDPEISARWIPIAHRRSNVHYVHYDLAPASAGQAAGRPLWCRVDRTTSTTYARIKQPTHIIPATAGMILYLVFQNPNRNNRGARLRRPDL